ESFNGKFRDECLNEHWFASVAEAQTIIEAWRVDYNTVRPHSALGGDTPEHFATNTEGARRRIAPRSYEDQKLEDQKPEDLSLSVERPRGAGKRGRSKSASDGRKPSDRGKPTAAGARSKAASKG